MDPPSSSSSSPPLPHKSKNVSAMKSHDQVECAAIYLYTLTSFSFLLIINSFTNNKSTIDGTKVTTSSLGSKTLNPLTFYPLKDFNVPSYRNPNKTWFMAPLMSQPKHSLPEHIVFPSKPPNYHKVLCIDPHNESYALATSNNSFPKGGVIARGMAFLANNLYDYDNPWHGLNAVLPFFTWMRERGRCEKPKRFVLFRNGKVVKKTGEWVHEFIKAMLDGEEALIDGIEEFKDRNVVCFEKAVVMKSGLGGMEGKKRHRLFEMVRCKAWKFCGVEAEDKEDSEVRISLVVRGGKRGFKNESRIREVMERECRRISDGGSRACRLQVVHLGNMSFCESYEKHKHNGINSRRATDKHGLHAEREQRNGDVPDRMA
ncbi:hypothetical protein LUZ60_002202 [Juncus effusus]|nr:hypothetical protein LUZ60_002202 [Juncus effusus]